MFFSAPVFNIKYAQSSVNLNMRNIIGLADFERVSFLFTVQLLVIWYDSVNNNEDMHIVHSLFSLHFSEKWHFSKKYS